MRTNIDIDQALLSDVMAATGTKTKREAVMHSLRKTLADARQMAAQRKILELRGKINWVGDLDAMRTD